MAPSSLVNRRLVFLIGGWCFESNWGLVFLIQFGNDFVSCVTGASSGYVEGFRLPPQLSASRGAGSGSGLAARNPLGALQSFHFVIFVFFGRGCFLNICNHLKPPGGNFPPLKIVFGLLDNVLQTFGKPLASLGKPLASSWQALASLGKPAASLW